MQPNEILKYFAKFIENELGIIYEESNYFQLQNRLEQIAKLQGLESIEKLYLLAQTSITGPFKQLLIDSATNNETSFFRDSKVFNAIEKVILNSRFESNTNSENKKNYLKIWSAASSTGQEAVSISILINEWIEKKGISLDFSILGTDISEKVLSRAKLGNYTQLEVQRGLSSPLLIKYFTKDINDHWLVKPKVNMNIKYLTLNLKNKYNLDFKFDLILCRNVLIYQNIESKKDILKRITEQLSPGGYLILGSGESLMGLSSDFEQVSFEGAILYKLKNKY